MNNTPNNFIKLIRVPENILVIIAVMTIAAISVAMLYSSAGGRWVPWARRQLLYFCFGFCVMLMAAIIDYNHYTRPIYFIYIVTVLLLVIVEVAGSVGMGAKRWVDFGIFQLQPSELMKLIVLITLAKYFSRLSYEQLRRPVTLIMPIIIVLIPFALILKQPNLGTATLLLLTSGAVFFIAGVRLWFFIGGIIVAIAAMPVVWHFMHQYQKNRVLSFFNSGDDQLGIGYNIIQAIIALGSGEFTGKGYLQGTQSRLKFVPEIHTDFIFPHFAEEFGFIGGLFLIALYMVITLYCFIIGWRVTSYLGKLLAIGIGIQISLYVFVNLAMTMGVVPVAGLPLPLLSYGGSSVVTFMLAIGVVLSVSIESKTKNGYHY